MEETLAREPRRALGPTTAPSMKPIIGEHLMRCNNGDRYFCGNITAANSGHPSNFPYPLRFNYLNGVPGTVKKIPILLQHKNPAPYMGMIRNCPLDSRV